MGPKGFLLYLLVLLVASSRGWLEILLNKPIAYLIQGVFLLIFFSYQILISISSVDVFSRFSLGLGALLFVGAFSLLSSLMYHAENPIIPIAVFGMNLINLTFLVMVLSLRSTCGISIKAFEVGLSAICLVVLFSSYLQFFGVVDFPGDARFNDFSRLSGSFGSKQHLSIVLGLLTFLTFLSARYRRSALYWTRFLLVFFTLLISLTRIGYLIFFMAVIPSLILGVVVGIRTRALRIMKGFALGVALLVVSLSALPSVFVNVVYERFKSFSFEERSQSMRNDAWVKGIDAYTQNSTYVYSDRLGTASQIPSRLFGKPTPHYESGILQYLINFGLLFTVLVFGLFLLWSFRMGSIDYFFLPLALFVSLFFYMSNEIIPSFIFFILVGLHARFYKSVLKSE